MAKAPVKPTPEEEEQKEATEEGDEAASEVAVVPSSTSLKSTAVNNNATPSGATPKTASASGGDSSTPPANAGGSTGSVPGINQEAAEVRPGERAPVPVSHVPVVIDYNDVRSSLDFVRDLKRNVRYWRSDPSFAVIRDRLRDWRALMAEKGGSASAYFINEINKFIPPEKDIV
jgi:hypothetical protein